MDELEKLIDEVWYARWLAGYHCAAGAFTAEKKEKKASEQAKQNLLNYIEQNYTKITSEGEI